MKKEQNHKVKKSVVALLIVALILIISSVSNTTATNKDKDNVVQIVRTYNESLPEAVKALDVTRLKPYTTEKQGKKLDLYIEYFRKQDVREIDELLAFKAENVVIKNDSAEVHTKEVWSVKQENVKTKQITDDGEAFYSTIYTLIKKNGKWYIDSIKPTELSSKQQK